MQLERGSVGSHSSSTVTATNHRGAEAHCRQIAERMARYYEDEVLTNAPRARPLELEEVLPAGRDELNGGRGRRFPSATERNLVEFHKIYDRIFLTQLTPEEEYEMLRHQGPNCPKLIEYLRNSPIGTAPSCSSLTCTTPPASGCRW